MLHVVLPCSTTLNTKPWSRILYVNFYILVQSLISMITELSACSAELSADLASLDARLAELALSVPAAHETRAGRGVSCSVTVCRGMSDCLAASSTDSPLAVQVGLHKC